MEQLSCKSKLSRSPPFRATQLWNEAVSTLQNGMPTRRHFYRMRYYDNCFSGKDAVEWLSRNLSNSPRFGKNVTVEGTRKLLQHFLKTGVFQSVKGSLTFKENGLFEFVDRTIHSPSHKQDNKLVFSHMGLKEIKTNIPPELRRHPIHEESRRKNQQCLPPCTSKKTDNKFSTPHWEQQSPSKDISWKDFILKRIQTLLPSLSVELLVDSATIQTDWVVSNVCPKYITMRKKTELPFWVYSAITSVVCPQEKESEYTTYTGFEKDVYTVVKDYLRHRSSPMIPYNLYELFMYTFNHLHYLDVEMKNRSRENNSVENLVLSMSHKWQDDHLVHMNDLTKTVLPPNSCFETAFTSDEPVTRIVPQSSIDTICLASYKTTKTLFSGSPTDNFFTPNTTIFNSCENISGFVSPPEKIFSPIIKRPVCNKYKNKKRHSYLKRTQSMAQIDTKWSTLPLAVTSSKTNKRNHTPQQSYVNYGLSQSVDDLLTVDANGDLDFEEAMQSVNCLLQASCGTQPSHVSSSSNITSSSCDSLSTVNSNGPNKTSLVCIDSCIWYEDIQETARLVFQSLLMLMPPVSRTSLRLLLQFISQLPVSMNSTITKTEIVYDLSAHILSPGPTSKNVYSHHMVISVVYFLVDNCQHVFEDLPEKELRNEEKESKENKSAEDPKVFCEQLTRNQFKDQAVTSSWLALAELLEQIINDKKMKSKEKKKRLKKFKEAYPHIYKQRFSGSSTNITNLVHFR